MKSHETLEMAAEAAGVGTWLLRLPQMELESSPRCKEIFGLTPEQEFPYQAFVALLHPESRAAVESAIEHALDPSGSGMYEIDYRIVRPDGAVRWLTGKGKAFFEDRDGRRVTARFIGTVLDRTEHKQTQDALIEAERLAMTGRLAASIAHEIKNPLNAVLNLLYLIGVESSASERSAYIQQAETELHRISEIATNTLHFYQDPAGVTSLDLGQLTQSVLLLFRGRVSTSKIQVDVRFGSGVQVLAAKGELRQVIVNLIGNALDAMPEGGRLLLRARRGTNARTGEPRVRLTIADTGSGMSPEVQRHIFEAFYTTKGTAGNGLGLWLSAEILKKYRASIRVRSTVGKGTVFQVSLVASAA